MEVNIKALNGWRGLKNQVESIKPNIGTLSKLCKQLKNI